MKKYIFAPGCALLIYKPHLSKRLHDFLNSKFGSVKLLTTCCRHTPEIPEQACVINICPGCDKRYRENYENPSTVSLWELLAEDNSFVFPDYKKEKMTIIDACPTRDQDRIHNSVRILAEKMNIEIVEPEKTRKKSTCCGDSFYGNVPTGKVIELIKKKAGEMPLDNILVYCVSCVKSMFTGNKKPRYLVDLLFGEETIPATYNPDEWHRELDIFIENEGK